MPDRQADLAYARVSTTAQDLDRQIDALREAGIAEEHIYIDKHAGANMDREGLTALIAFARPGDRMGLLDPFVHGLGFRARVGSPEHRIRSSRRVPDAAHQWHQCRECCLRVVDGMAALLDRFARSSCAALSRLCHARDASRV